MRFAAIALMIAASFLVTKASNAASADDKKWVSQCQKDNKDEGAKQDVVLKYCTCMNDKMDDKETRSITQWEKSHESERKACERTSGWK